MGEYVQGRFYNGVKTGLNEAFVVNRATRDRLISEHKSSAVVLKARLPTYRFLVIAVLCGPHGRRATTGCENGRHQTARKKRANDEAGALPHPPGAGRPGAPRGRRRGLRLHGDTDLAISEAVR